MICNVKDLSSEQKAAIESLLGRRIMEDETISVRAIAPAANERRRELVEQLRQHFAEVDARGVPGSPEEEDEITTEAMRSVRPGYRRFRR